MPTIANFRRVQVEESKVQGHPQLYSRLEVNLRYICPHVGGGGGEILENQQEGSVGRGTCQV